MKFSPKIGTIAWIRTNLSHLVADAMNQPMVYQGRVIDKLASKVVVFECQGQRLAVDVSHLHPSAESAENNPPCAVESVEQWYGAQADLYKQVGFERLRMSSKSNWYRTC